MPEFELRFSGTWIGMGGSLKVGSIGPLSVKKVVLPTGRTMGISLTGVPASTPAPTITSDNPNIVEVFDVVREQNRVSFFVRSKGAGVRQIIARDSAGNNLDTLLVSTGPIHNHPGMDFDLIAQTYNRGSAAEMQALTRLLHNVVDNLFNENSALNVAKHGTLACGTVAKVAGREMWFRQIEYDYSKYHGPLPRNGHNRFEVPTREDVKYDRSVLDRGMKAIAERLKNGKPSVLGVTYIPSSAVEPTHGYIRSSGATGAHSVLAVGSNKDGSKIMYIDVWGPDGSSDSGKRGSFMKYAGGPPGEFSTECEHLGMFELVDTGRAPMKYLRQVSATQAPGGMFDGEQYLEVVSGPLK